MVVPFESREVVRIHARAVPAFVMDFGLVVERYAEVNLVGSPVSELRFALPVEAAVTLPAGVSGPDPARRVRILATHELEEAITELQIGRSILISETDRATK